MPRDAKWITSRWEDVRKDTGELRSRWVLREFANTKAEGEFFSATPDETKVEAVHLFALLNNLEIKYMDASRAFLHAPEDEDVYTDSPKCWECEGQCWKLIRNINGRRNGSQSFTEWLPIQVQGVGFFFDEESFTPVPLWIGNEE